MLTQLALSGVARLTVKCTLDDRYSPLPLLDHAERLQSLQFYGIGVFITRFMVRLTERQLPVLRSIDVDPNSCDNLSHDETVHLLDALFDGRAPSLRSLKVPQSFVNWELLHHLEDLSVKDDQSAPLPSFPSVLHALRRSPSLKTLKLYFPRASDVERNPSLRVELPLLRILDVSADAETCCALLLSLNIPITASIHLYPQEISMSRSELQDLLAPLHRHYFATSAHALRLNRINCPGPYSVIDFYTETASFDLPGTSSAYFTIKSHTRNVLSRQVFISEVLGALPVRSVTHLDTRRVSQTTGFAWSMVIRLLPALDTIYVRIFTSAENVGNALLQMLKSEERFLRLQRLPRLQRVRLEAFYYSEDSVYLPQGFLQRLSQRLLSTWCQILLRYQELNAPVQVLEITHTSRIPGIEDMQDKLCDLVATFILDGVVYGPLKYGENN